MRGKFTRTQTDNSMRFEISSEIPLIRKIMAETDGWVGSVSPADRYALKIVLRELLTNAVIHGNRNKSERMVMCSVEKRATNGIRVVVQDEGSGLDFRRLSMAVPCNPQHLRKRGYVIINALAERIEFNESGNRTTVFLLFNQDQTLAMDPESGSQ